jgi:hypothetical protein
MGLVILPQHSQLLVSKTQVARTIYVDTYQDVVSPAEGILEYGLRTAQQLSQKKKIHIV